MWDIIGMYVIVNVGHHQTEYDTFTILRPLLFLNEYNV